MVRPCVQEVLSIWLMRSCIGFRCSQTEADEGAYGWRYAVHIDHVERPAAASMLHAIEVPSVGGNTLFANAYLAYETLPAGHQCSVRPSQVRVMSGTMPGRLGLQTGQGIAALQEQASGRTLNRAAGRSGCASQTQPVSSQIVQAIIAPTTAPVASWGRC
jgi:hypothetical protein